MVKEWKQKEKTELRNWLIGVLKTTSPVTIVFEKKDGTERTLLCTLKEEIVIPYEAKTDTKKEKSEETLGVWDIEKSAWRSFRLDSIKQINFGLV